MSGCNNGLPNCITPLPMDASGKMSDYEFLCYVNSLMNTIYENQKKILQELEALELGGNRVYLNVVENGIANDGVTDVTQDLQNLFNEHKGETFYFPPGTYAISNTLIVYGTNPAVSSIILDGAVIKAVQNINGAMIRYGTGSSEPTVYQNMNGYSIRGNGVLDMNSMAQVGLLVENRSRFFRLDGIVIKNVGGGTALQMGDGEGQSSSAQISNLIIFGVNGGNNVNSIGIDCYSWDSQFNNVIIFQCYYGIVLNGGGHTLNNVHIWNDIRPSDANYLESTGIRCLTTNNILTNIYLDNCPIGIYCLYKLEVVNLFYYLPYTPDSNMDVCIFNTSQANNVNVIGLYATSKTNYTITNFRTQTFTPERPYFSNARIKIQSLQTDTSGFNVLDPVYDITTNVASKMVCQSYGQNIQPNNYLIGYMLKGSGSLDLDVTLGSNSCVTFKFQLDRVNGIKQYTIDTSRCSAPDIKLWSLVIGNEISYNNVSGKSVWPVYFSLKSTTNVTLGVTAKSYAEAAFFMPLVRTWDDMVVNNSDVMEEIEIIGEYNETYYVTNEAFTLGYNHIVKYKDVVTLTVTMQSGAVTDGQTLFVLPEAVRPKANLTVEMMGYNLTDHTTSEHRIILQTDGNCVSVAAWNDYSNFSLYSLTCSYVIF